MSIPYEKLKKLIDEELPRMTEAEDFLWANPQTGYREWKAHAYLAQSYEKLGYTLTMAGNIPGFIADYDTGRPGPRVVIMGEMDSLLCLDHPDADMETGAVHACGHSAQNAALLGVAAALRKPGAAENLCGSVRFCIVPAEELIEVGYREELRRQGIIHYFGGKPEFVRRGLLDGCDIAFMVHTSEGKHKLSVSEGCNGCAVKNMEFLGTAAHAGGSPHKGINALYAANLALSAANALRETFRDEEHIRFHPIVTYGGTAVNAVPSKITLESYVRGKSFEAIRRESMKISRAMAGCAAAMGANVILSDRPGYMPLNNDPTLTQIAVEAMKEVVAEENVSYRHEWDTICTDMGDISALMPTVHPFSSGSVGTMHGCDYRVADVDSALGDSAKLQLILLYKLLSDNAAEAKRVMASYTPLFTKEEYLAAMDALTLDKRAVTYDEDGSIRLDYC